MFAAPWAFLALLSLPALAGLYWLRNSYRRLTVSSLMLWLEQAESRASGLRVRRLHTPLLFFLELAALSLLAVAATGPRLETNLARWPLVIVLDDSYSMLAGKDDSPRQRAQAALERELSGDLPLGVRFVLAGAFPQALGESVSSLTEVHAVLAGWRCRSPVSRLPEAITLATELGGERSRILVISDHAPPSESPVGRIGTPSHVQWRAFGKALANVALVQANRTMHDDQERLALEIANLAAQAETTTLVLETAAPALEVHRETLTLAKGESRRILLQFKRELPALRVHLSEDALELDNQAWLLAEARPQIRVAVKIDDEPLRALVEKALQATGRTVAPGFQPVEKVKPASTEAQLLFTDAADDVGDSLETWVCQVLREKEAEAYLGPFVLDRTHPLTEGLGLAGVVWGGGKSQDLAGTPVVMAGNIPLLTDTENLAGQHRLRLRLRPDLSTLPQSPAWPVLFWNLVSWRATELPGLRRVNVRLGEAVTLTVPLGVEAVTVTSPDGASRTLPLFQRKVVVQSSDVGKHEIQAGENKYTFAANTLNREESDLSLCVTGQWGEWAEESSAPAWRQLAWVLLLVTLGVLTVHLVLARR